MAFDVWRVTFLGAAGRVAIISAADGRFVCAAGAAPFSSPRCHAACQFLIMSPPTRATEDDAGGDKGQGGRGGDCRLSPCLALIIPPLPTPLTQTPSFACSRRQAHSSPRTQLHPPNTLVAQRTMCSTSLTWTDMEPSLSSPLMAAVTCRQQQPAPCAWLRPSHLGPWACAKRSLLMRCPRPAHMTFGGAQRVQLLL